MKGSLPALMSPVAASQCPPRPLGPLGLPGSPPAPCPVVLMSGRAEKSFRPLTLHFYDFYSPWSPVHTVAGRDYPCPGRSWAWPDSGGPVRSGQPFGGTGHRNWGPPSWRSYARPPHSTSCVPWWLGFGSRTQLGQEGWQVRREDAEHRRATQRPSTHFLPCTSPPPTALPPRVPPLTLGKHGGPQGAGSEWGPITAPGTAPPAGSLCEEPASRRLGTPGGPCSLPAQLWLQLPQLQTPGQL